MNFDMNALEAELRRDEGTVLQVYDDATGNVLKPGNVLKGNPTIGTGRNLLGRGLSAAESTYLLGNDITMATDALNTSCPWWVNLDDVRARALINMCFNMGISRLLTFHNFLSAMARQDWQTAGAEMQNSAWWNQVGERAVRLQYMVLNGVTMPGAI